MSNDEQGATAVREPERMLPVAGSCDVLVAGGGIAGVAAAVAAARQGASVCLLERGFGLGGLATLGNVIVWLPLCDGRGRQVSAGLAEEMLKLAATGVTRPRPQARFQPFPACWRPGGDPADRRKHRYRVDFNPQAYLLDLEDWVLEAGVKLLYDTRVCAVRRAGDRITHLVVENKSGRQAWAGRTVVDATGEADICWQAGEPTESLDTNVLTGWFYFLRGDELKLEAWSNRYDPVAGRAGAAGPFFRGDDAESVTAQVTGSRAKIRARVAAIRAAQPGTDIQPLLVPGLPCFRMTRRLAAPFALGARHAHEYFEDTVGLTGDWRRAGPVYAVPYRALCAPGARNLLVAGRCMSADTTVWDVMRALPGCAVTGEAAGVAAALAAARDGDAAGLPVALLRERLAAARVLLDPDLARPAPGEGGP